MEAYGRAAGAMFDELLAVPQSDVLGAETVRMFDSLFYDLMDGILLLSYRKSAEVSLPRDMKCLEAAAVHIQNGEGFKLEELARGMAACGVEESRAYKMILDAIEKDLLVKAEQDKGDASETVVESSS
jgi:hypothetical protein